MLQYILHQKHIFYYDTNKVPYSFYPSTTGVHQFNGCFGKLIVRELNGKDPHEAIYDHDLEQHHVIISDWSNFLGEDFLPLKRNEDQQLVASLLINGYGSFKRPNASTRTFAPIAAFSMQRGQRYRWRIINAITQNCPIRFCVRISWLDRISP